MITGIFLAMHYCGDVDKAFASMASLARDVNNGFYLRWIHINGASIFFICAYVHIGRGIYYGSYVKKLVWFIGVLLYLIMMGTAFLGYVLP